MDEWAVYLLVKKKKKKEFSLPIGKELAVCTFGATFGMMSGNNLISNTMEGKYSMML